MSRTIGVLVMAYGTPGSREEVEPYYTRIRHGRPPTPEQLDDLVRRYDAIGGISPLAERTAAQVAGLADRLDQLAPGRYDVRFGSKYTEPSIEATAESFRADGIDEVVGIVLTPHQASMGSVEYMTRAAAALGDEVAFHPVLHWYDVDGFAQLQGRRVTEAVGRLPQDERGEALLLVTAHSLPARIVEAGDPYPDQLADSAAQIAQAAGNWRSSWTSSGRQSRSCPSPHRAPASSPGGRCAPSRPTSAWASPRAGPRSAEATCSAPVASLPRFATWWPRGPPHAGTSPTGPSAVWSSASSGPRSSPRSSTP